MKKTGQGFSAFRMVLIVVPLLLLSCGNGAGCNRTTSDSVVIGNSPDRTVAVQKIELPGSGLDNFYCIDTGVYRSEQPGYEGFRALEEYGIREVLSLRNFHTDTRKARGTSLCLHHIRTRASKISEAEVTEALRIIKDRTGPIVIHCWHGSDRTGAVIAMYRIVFQGYSKEEAIREMSGGGFGFHAQFQEIVLMIQAADIDRIRKELE